MLTAAQIQKIEMAMRGPGPDWDPDWALMQQLLMLFTVQSKEIIALQAQLDAVNNAAEASHATIINALQRGLSDNHIATNPLSPAEVEGAVENIKKAISAAESGQEAVTIASHILRFAAKLII